MVSLVIRFAFSTPRWMKLIFILPVFLLSGTYANAGQGEHIIITISPNSQFQLDTAAAIWKNLEAIEVDVFALQNALDVNYPELSKEKTIAIINLGANITNVIIIEKNVPQLFRDLSLGGSFFTENISKDLGISFDDAEKLLKGLPVKNVEPERYEAILNMNIQNILEEVEKTFSFYEAGEKAERKIEAIFLSGGLSKLKDLAAKFEQKFNMRTELFNPFRRIYYDEKKFDSIYFDEMAALFGVATGLATRKLEK